MLTTLVGGGWTVAARGLVWGPFLDAVGRGRTVACVVLDEGDGAQQFSRWAEALAATAPCRPVPVLVPEGGRLDVAGLGDAAGLLVCGGLTPAYAAALAPVAGELRDWLADGPRPYAGFSAGAAVAAADALVGGWRDGEVPVCPPDAGEDLDQVTVTAGLGLVPFTVDVHATQWGTLPRLLAAVRRGAVARGVALDEDTALLVDGDEMTVQGLGRVHVVLPATEGALVRSVGAGQRLGPADLRPDQERPPLRRDA